MRTTQSADRSSGAGWDVHVPSSTWGHWSGTIASALRSPFPMSDDLFHAIVTVDCDADFEGAVGDGAHVVRGVATSVNPREVCFDDRDAGSDSSSSLGGFGLGECFALPAELCEGGVELIDPLDRAVLGRESDIHPARKRDPGSSKLGTTRDGSMLIPFGDGSCRVCRSARTTQAS